MTLSPDVVVAKPGHTVEYDDGTASTFLMIFFADFFAFFFAAMVVPLVLVPARTPVVIQTGSRVGWPGNGASEERLRTISDVLVPLKRPPGGSKARVSRSDSYSCALSPLAGAGEERAREECLASGQVRRNTGRLLNLAPHSLRFPATQRSMHLDVLLLELVHVGQAQREQMLTRALGQLVRLVMRARARPLDDRALAVDVKLRPHPVALRAEDGARELVARGHRAARDDAHVVGREDDLRRLRQRVLLLDDRRHRALRLFHRERVEEQIAMAVDAAAEVVHAT